VLHGLPQHPVAAADISNSITNDQSKRYWKQHGFIGGLSYAFGMDDEDESKVKKHTGGIKHTTYRPPSKLKIAHGPLNFTGDVESAISYAKHVDLRNLNPEFRKLVFGMALEYHEITGKKLIIVSAYRSQAYQARLKRRAKNKNAVGGSKSMHCFGLAVDIHTPQAQECVDLGLYRKYGLTRPLTGKNEAWHTEPALCQIDLNRSRNDPEWASEQCRLSPGHGGPGYNSMTGKVKGIHRSKSFQLAEIRAGDTLVATNSKDHIDTIKHVIKKRNRIVHSDAPILKAHAISAVHNETKYRNSITQKAKILDLGLEGEKNIAKANTRHITSRLDRHEKIKHIQAENHHSEKITVLSKSLDVQTAMLSELRKINDKLDNPSNKSSNDSGNKAPKIHEANLKPPVSLETNTL